MNSSGTAHYKGRRPVIIHPEGTKTNGTGVLQIDKEVIALICKTDKKDNLKIHSLRFDYDFKYWCPINTTEQSGLMNLLESVKQFTSKMKI